MRLFLLATGKKAPLAPSSLTATAVSANRIDLAWTNNATSYDGTKIERSTDGVNFTEITDVASGVTTYSSTGLSGSTQYYYRVRAYKGSLNSDYSNTANATTLAPGLELIIEIDTTITETGSSASDQFRVTPTPLGTIATANYQVDWGDGVVDSFTGTTQRTHTYAVPGVYDVKITGSMAFYVNGSASSDRRKFLNIKQWGTNQQSNSNNWHNFRGCSNMVITATDAPNIAPSSNMTDTFRDCTSLTNEDFSSWDVSTINIFSNVFRTCANFNGNVDSWDVSSASTLSGFFQTCLSFNRDLSNWDVSSCTSFSSMFNGATGMQNNASIAGWPIGASTSSTGINFNSFLDGVDYTPDLSSWSMVRAGIISSMLRQGRSDYDYGAWDIRNVTSATSFMSSANPLTLSAINLANMYIAWSQLPVRNISISFGSAKYDASGASARAILTGARAVGVTGAIDPNANGTYTWNGNEYINLNGWFFFYTSGQWNLYDPSLVSQAVTTGSSPLQHSHNPVSGQGWTGTESGIVVTMVGAGWTISDGGQL